MNKRLKNAIFGLSSIAALAITLLPSYAFAAPAQCFVGMRLAGPTEVVSGYTSVPCDEKYQSFMGTTKVEDDKFYLVEFDDANKVIYSGLTTEAGVKKQVGNTNDPNGSFAKLGYTSQNLITQYGKIAAGNANPSGNSQPSAQAQAGNSQDCPQPSNSFFFGLPTWYKYLPPGPNCAISLYKTNAQGQPEVVDGKYQYDIGKLWLIGLAIADMLLILVGLVTVFIIISGGYKYITSQFDPEGTKKGKDTILNGLIGLAIVILATTIVNIVGNTLN